MKAPTISRAIEQTEGDFLLGLDLGGGAVELGGVLARRNSLHAHQLNCTNCRNKQYFIQMMPSVIASNVVPRLVLPNLGPIILDDQMSSFMFSLKPIVILRGAPRRPHLVA
jgi:hypothetical protein